jgi:hypothetical protein
MSDIEVRIEVRVEIKVEIRVEVRVEIREGAEVYGWYHLERCGMTTANC